ncbi:hypothetical protein QP178_05440 [Sphingomonas aurantiaca]|uniref:hypothetical protein n=1 Tax=Sphingomonas aurantiaca TaxID=185949 RepID=UPI002FE39E9F
MDDHALAIAGKNFEALTAWLNGPADASACSASKNCLGALAELVFALHIRGELVGHRCGHDVVSRGETFEVRTLSNGGRPDYRGKIADRFVDVKIIRSGPRLVATEVWSRPGCAIANDGTDPWKQDVTFQAVVIV